MAELNYFNHAGYTDVHPFELVREVSTKTADIRAMSAERDPTWEPTWEVGGFSAHCLNQQEQRWVITSNPEAAIIRVRLHQDGYWRDKHGNAYNRQHQPRRFHDYNF